LSSRRARRLRDLYLLGALTLTSSVGCWEQWSNDWFPQMKWQPAVQAFERTMHLGKVDPFLPPDGTVPVGAPGPAPMDPLNEAAQSAIPNPRPPTLASLENGRVKFETFCAPCHGASGAGDGPVSMTSPNPLKGPFPGVLAVTGPASLARIRTDGHVYSTIRYGRRRMPAYRRIPDADRWDIVNYIRYLDGQRGVTQ
jgi:mono/diheme cytochrome c family protein